MRTVEEIVAMFTARKKATGPVMERMREVREMTRGELIVPLNELDRNARASVANLATQGIDQMAMRVASVLPSPYFPPLKDGVEQSAKMARMRKRAMESMWDHNRFDLKMRRRARLLLAYGTSPIVLKPDFKKNMPTWQVRNPLDTYPAFTEDPDDIVPENVIFTYVKDASWLLKNYGSQVSNLNMGKVTADSRYRILEYVCGNELVLVAMGADDGTHSDTGWMEAVELERIPNRTGMPLAVVPRRITLDEVRGQFDNMVGMFYTRARLQALTEIAIERGIFPDEYLIARPGENPEIIQTADGKLGQLGVVKGGDMKESKTMVKKEIGFMKKAGAPKSMIKHEMAEAKGKPFAKGGMSLAKHASMPASKAHKGLKAGGMATKMGAVKTAAPSMNGIASKGKTKGTMVKMARGGKTC